MGEYIAMSASSALIVTLFFGGYQIPWLNTAALHTHIEPIFIALILIIPLLSLSFIRWMRRNNSCDLARRKETFYATIFIAVFVIVIEAFLFYAFFSGLSFEQNALFVMLLQILSFIIKVFLMNFVFVWVRWTFPRFRYDQTQHLGWKILLPLALLNIFISAIIVVAGV